MVASAGTQPAYWPPAPESLEELGIPSSLVTDLMLRRAYVTGLTSLHALSEAIKLPPIVLEAVFRELRAQQLVEVKGMTGNDYQFALSGGGRALAADRFRICHYAGPCPVSLKQYQRAVKLQSPKVKLDRRTLHQVFSDLVLSERLLDQVGPAILSGDAIFLYGPTGSGKTSLAERIVRVFQDFILVPHAIEVDSQIIQLFDPVVHEAAPIGDEEMDQRWVVCRRPSVIAGGELTLEMLALRLDEATGIYSAPIQLKANNGVLVIDDFGRQLVPPRELLNRWMVPLDRRVDYLALRYGVKFQIPFEIAVVFATNLDPRDLADEAFLRRLPNKIYVEAIEPALFDEIFRRVSTARSIPVEPDSADYLRKLCLKEGSMELRACYPADICNILIAISNYEGRPPRASKPDLERAVALYFAQT